MRHFGQGIGRAVTHAANISWARRSDASGGRWAIDGETGAEGVVDGADVGAGATRELGGVGASRPQWGQNRPPVPVGSRPTWQLGHRGEAPHDLGRAGAACTAGPGAAGPADGAGGGGGGGRDHMTVPAIRS